MDRALSASSHGVSGLSAFSRRANGFPSSRVFSHRPFSVRMAALSQKQTQTYWANLEADIESHLKKAIPIREPVSVFEPMHYLTFSAPRTSAPALCIAACELVGGDREKAMAAAAAIHLMHAAAYAHQHLPLTDRPRPEFIEHRFGPNVELLTGDGIIPFGMELLSESINFAGNDAGRVLRVIVEITQATGSQGLLEGQYKEMDIAESDCGDAALIEYVCRKKEGELHACAAACGAILGGASEEEIQKLRRYGLYAGMIKAMLHGFGRSQKTGLNLQKRVEKLRAFAMKELQSFQSFKNGKVDGILTWFESQLCNDL